MWEIDSTPVFDEWFAALTEDAQDETAIKIEMLRRIGPRLSRQHADTLNDSKHANMKELRVDTATQVLRIAFAFDPERRGIMLVAGNKSGVGQRRFYRQLIAKADELYDAHLTELRFGEPKKENTMARPIDELFERTMSKQRRAKAAARAQELVAEYLLSEVRELMGKSQSEIAKKLGIKQPSLSKLEKQTDIQVSTLQRIVEALGGTLEVTAKFPNATVKIDQFDKRKARPRGRKSTARSA